LKNTHKRMFYPSYLDRPVVFKGFRTDFLQVGCQPWHSTSANWRRNEW